MHLSRAGDDLGVCADVHVIGMCMPHVDGMAWHGMAWHGMAWHMT